MKRIIIAMLLCGAMQVVPSQQLVSAEEDSGETKRRAAYEEIEKRAHEDIERREIARKLNDPSWSESISAVESMFKNNDVKKHIQIRVANAISKCVNEVSYKLWDSNQDKTKVDAFYKLAAKFAIEQISGEYLKNLLFSSQFTDAYRKKLSTDFTLEYSTKTLQLAEKMLDDENARPIAIKWFTSNLNIKFSCLGKVNKNNSTIEDLIYTEIRKELKY